MYITWIWVGTQWCNLLRHCATSWQVAGSIPSGVTGIFHWHNLSGCTVALGSTQPLTEMSTRNVFWGIRVLIVWNLRISTFWSPQGLSRPVQGLLCLPKYNIGNTRFVDNMLPKTLCWVSHLCLTCMYLWLKFRCLCYFNLIHSCVTSCFDVQVNIEEMGQSVLSYIFFTPIVIEVTIMFGKKLIVLCVGILSVSSFYMPDDDFQYSQSMLQYRIQ
jgi:hypothetical protein